MQYVFVTYRSRSVSMQAYNFLVKNGITAALISTPRAAKVGCGLSVKFPYEVLAKVCDVLKQGETFVGFFLVKITHKGNVVSRL